MGTNNDVPIRKSEDQRVMLDELHHLYMDLQFEAMKSHYSAEEQKDLARTANELRMRLVKLRVARFNRNTEGYADATKTLEEINEELARFEKQIEKLKEFIELTVRLVAALDKILKALVPVA